MDERAPQEIAADLAAAWQAWWAEWWEPVFNAIKGLAYLAAFRTPASSA